MAKVELRNTRHCAPDAEPQSHITAAMVSAAVRPELYRTFILTIKELLRWASMGLTVGEAVGEDPRSGGGGRVVSSPNEILVLRGAPQRMGGECSMVEGNCR